MLTAHSLAQAIARMSAGKDAMRDTLNAADRQLGDGDTGMTVAQVLAGWSSAAAALPSDVGAALVVIGRETSRSTGSSLGAVLAMALSAAGRAVRGKETLARSDIVTALQAAAGAVLERSGATPGDKSFLDALLAMARRLEQAGEDADLLREAEESVQECVLQFRARPSKLGRARMYGDRSIGHDDPGMLAVMLLVAQVRAADEFARRPQ